MTAPGTLAAFRPEAGPSGIGAGASSPVEVLAAGEGAPASASWFERIVRPLSGQEFLDTRYRDKRPVLFRAERPRFAPLCTWDALNGLLSSTAWQRRIRLVRDGKPLPEDHYTTPYFGHGWRARRGLMEQERQIDDGRLAAFLRQGATIVMPGLHDLHPPVRPLVDALDEALGGYAGVNLYASWTATRGFATHWDDHDVFVLQVAGAKRWHLYGETRRFPLPRDTEPNVDPPRETVWSGVLRPGDVFYIPRGWWHDARVESGGDANGGGSLHLSCSVLPATGLDLMEWLTGRLARHETFRRDLPHPTDGAGDTHYAALRELVLEELQGDLGGRFRGHLRSTWSERPRTSLGPSVEPWKSPDWERYGLRLRGASHATMQRTDDGDAVLEANGYRWTLDGRCMDLMAPLLRGEVVRVGAFRAGAAVEGAAVEETASEGAASEGAASEGASSASFADELARLLVTRGIAQAVPPPDPASGPQG